MQEQTRGYSLLTVHSRKVNRAWRIPSQCSLCLKESDTLECYHGCFKGGTATTRALCSLALSSMLSRLHTYLASTLLPLHSSVASTSASTLLSPSCRNISAALTLPSFDKVSCHLLDAVLPPSLLSPFTDIFSKRVSLRAKRFSNTNATHVTQPMCPPAGFETAEL